MSKCITNKSAFLTGLLPLYANIFLHLWFLSLLLKSLYPSFFFFFFFLSFSMTSILQPNLSARTETSHNVLLLGCVFTVFLPMSRAKRHCFLDPRLLGLYPPTVAVLLSRQVFTQPFSCLPVRSRLQTFTTPAVG